MRKSVAVIAAAGLAFSATAAAASDNRYHDPFGYYNQSLGHHHRHHAGERCNAHKHPPRGFRCKRIHGQFRLAKRHR